LGRFSIFDGLK